MRKSLISLALAASAILPVMWFRVIPYDQMKLYCTRADGCLVKYEVFTQDGELNPVTLTFNTEAQKKLCDGAGF